MNPKVQVRRDSERGCGWRKAGGLYLISGGVSAPCGILPIPLTNCPNCEMMGLTCAINPTRGWTWINPMALATGKTCSFDMSECRGCPLARLTGQHGLLWIGGSFYEKPGDWTDEAIRQGVSRRIAAVPNGFELGTTWVFVAHREHSRTGCKECKGSGYQLLPGTAVIVEGSPECMACGGDGSIAQAAIFHAFKPSSIEYVVKGDETEEELDRLIARGITPVEVERVGAQQELPEVEVEEDLTEVQL